MSEQALQYYQERVERLDLQSMPTILGGQPMLLTGNEPTQRLSLQSVNPKTLDALTDCYGQILTSTRGFVTEAYNRSQGQELPHVPATSNWLRANIDHLEGIVTKKLFPRTSQAGHMRNIQIEALARREVKGYLLCEAGSTAASNPKAEDSEVYLRMSGELFAGRPLGRAACLTVVSAVNTGAGLTHRYSAGRYRQNDLLALSGLAQSKATRAYIDMWGVRTQQMQNTGRGVRQRGRAA